MSAKINIFLLILIVATAFSSPGFAETDDPDRIDQCVVDNRYKNQSAGTVLKYCLCMDEKIPENEIQSIKQWKKTHKTENDACRAKAGWKYSIFNN